MKPLRLFFFLLGLSLAVAVNSFSQNCSFGSFFTFSIKDNISASDTATLIFGNHPYATYGLDTLGVRIFDIDVFWCLTFREEEIPPPPQDFDARWNAILDRPRSITFGKIDIRAVPTTPEQKDTFVLRLQNPNLLKVRFTLKWGSEDSLRARCDSMYLVDTTHQLPPINMFRQDSVEVVLDNGISDVLSLEIFKYGVHLVDIINDVHAVPENLPAAFTLGQNWPNPLNPSTTIHFSLPKYSHVTLSIHNVLGQLVQTVADDNRPAGDYDVVVDGSKWASGVYFYRFDAVSVADPGKSFTSVKKMVLCK